MARDRCRLIVYDAYRRRVVDVDWGRRLWVAHLFQCEADDLGFHGVEEEGYEFGFCGGSGNTFQDGAIC